MTETLLDAPAAAAILGLSPSTFKTYRRQMALPPAAKSGKSFLYAQTDVEALRDRRAAEAAAKPAPKAKRSSVDAANDKMTRQLERDDATADWGKGRRLGQLSTAEKAIVWAAVLQHRAGIVGALGPTSQWLRADPPASYKAAFDRVERGKRVAA